ncbi:MAG: leucine-rich repeat protein [Clostridia bacterium]|nr:leucine-rich repeat protein [Clostridia bacterium]
MKKITKLISLLLVVLMVFSVMPISASALVYSGEAGENVTWTYDTKTDVIKFSGWGPMYDYGTIRPTQWNLYKATIKEVVIGDGITHIGSNSFEACAISKVTIPDSVVSIGNDAFRGCYNLVTIVIPDSVTTMGISVFETCSNLKNVKLSENLEIIDNRTFHGCLALDEIEIPDSVTAIHDRAFYHCQDLTRIEIPDSVETIKIEAFAYCHNLSSLDLGKGIKNIGTSAFSFTALETVHFPASIESIGTTAFFSDTQTLKKAYFEKGVEKIDPTAFNVSNADGGTSVGLTDIYFSGTESEWLDIDAALFRSYFTGTMHYTHSHEYKEEIIVKPTCAEGLSLMKCVDCGSSYYEKTAPVRSHNFSERLSIDLYATCVKSGLLTLGCTGCDATKQVPTSKNPNNHANTREVGYAKETCGKDGYSGDIFCDACSKQVVYGKVIPATGNHKDDNHDGLCDVCGTDTTVGCDCLCHKGGALAPLWSFVRFFWKLFKMNTLCECGKAHY